MSATINPFGETALEIAKHLDAFSSGYSLVFGLMFLFFLYLFGEFCLEIGTAFRIWITRTRPEALLLVAASKANHPLIIEEYRRTRQQIELQDAILGAALITSPVYFLIGTLVGTVNVVVLGCVILLGVAQPFGSIAAQRAFGKIVDAFLQVQNETKEGAPE